MSVSRTRKKGIPSMHPYDSTSVVTNYPVHFHHDVFYFTGAPSKKEEKGEGDTTKSREIQS